MFVFLFLFFLVLLKEWVLVISEVRFLICSLTYKGLSIQLQIWARFQFLTPFPTDKFFAWNGSGKS